MAQSQTTNMTCDRCSEVQSITPKDPENLRYHWAKVWAQEANGPLRISAGHREPIMQDCRDLCPPCMGSLMAWWGRGRP